MVNEHLLNAKTSPLDARRQLSSINSPTEGHQFHC